MARENGIQVMGFSNLASSSYVEIGGATAEENPQNLPAVKDIAQRHSKTPAQVLLRWGLQRGTAIIPKSSKMERIEENFALFDFNLSQAEVAVIDGLDRNRRYNDPGVYAEMAFGCYCPIFE